MRNPKSLLKGGISKINAEAKQEIQAFECLTIPKGTKLIIIKDKEIFLESPLLHIESKLENDKYTYQREKAILTTGTEIISYQVLIYNNRTKQYYTIENSYKKNENTIFHYYCHQVDISQVLIYDDINQIDNNTLWDFNSIPFLLNLFTEAGIDIYPKELLVNELFLKKKGLFIDLIDSIGINQCYNPQNPISKRRDIIRFYLNNYTNEDTFTLQNQIFKMIQEGKLQILNKYSSNDIKTIKQTGLYASIGAFFELEIFYTISQEAPIPLQKYIQKVSMDIKKRGDNV